jgi:hypothetical protein
MRQPAPHPSLCDLETDFPLLLGGDMPKRPTPPRLGRESATSSRYETETPVIVRRKTGLLDFLFGV